MIKITTATIATFVVGCTLLLALLSTTGAFAQTSFARVAAVATNGDCAYAVAYYNGVVASSHYGTGTIYWWNEDLTAASTATTTGSIQTQTWVFARSGSRLFVFGDTPGKGQQVDMSTKALASSWTNTSSGETIGACNIWSPTAGGNDRVVCFSENAPTNVYVWDVTDFGNTPEWVEYTPLRGAAYNVFAGDYAYVVSDSSGGDELMKYNMATRSIVNSITKTTVKSGMSGLGGLFAHGNTLYVFGNQGSGVCQVFKYDNAHQSGNIGAPTTSGPTWTHGTTCILRDAVELGGFLFVTQSGSGSFGIHRVRQSDLTKVMSVVDFSGDGAYYGVVRSNVAAFVAQQSASNPMVVKIDLGIPTTASAPTTPATTTTTTTTGAPITPTPNSAGYVAATMIAISAMVLLFVF